MTDRSQRRHSEDYFYSIRHVKQESYSSRIASYHVKRTVLRLYNRHVTFPWIGSYLQYEEKVTRDTHPRSTKRTLSRRISDVNGSTTVSRVILFLAYSSLYRNLLISVHTGHTIEGWLVVTSVDDTLWDRYNLFKARIHTTASNKYPSSFVIRRVHSENEKRSIRNPHKTRDKELSISVEDRITRIAPSSHWDASISIKWSTVDLHISSELWNPARTKHFLVVRRCEDHTSIVWISYSTNFPILLNFFIIPSE